MSLTTSSFNCPLKYSKPFNGFTSAPSHNISLMPWHRLAYDPVICGAIRIKADVAEHCEGACFNMEYVEGM